LIQVVNLIELVEVGEFSSDCFIVFHVESRIYFMAIFDEQDQEDAKDHVDHNCHLSFVQNPHQ